MSFSNAPISFPGLFGDWQFTVPSKALNIGNGIYWYGIIIAVGMLLGLYFCMKQAHKYGLSEDNIIDTVLWAIPFSIIGARIYYVLFYLDLFRNSDGSINWSSTYRIWDGGLAIYGGVIAGFLTAYLFSRRKKISFWALTDCCVQGLFIGQAIGRWGNFINREAFGGLTDLPWRMRLWTSGTTYVDVHPTFLYESLWNLIGLLLLYLALWLILGIYLVPTVMKKLVGLMNDEVLLVFSLGLCFLMAVLAEEIGLSTELGAFLAGSLLAGTVHAERAEHLF